MINTFSHLSRHPNAKTRLFHATSFLAVAGLFTWWGKLDWLFPAAAVLLALLMILPGVGSYVTLAWSAIGCTLGYAVTNLVVAAFYYLILTPTGILLRIAGKNQISQRFDPSLTSTWRSHREARSLLQYFKQF
ncbi:MAG: hypothetical protein PHS41_08515 [Victivallaceae bacterium]|nr:hypothetical protein [Victivallaceae bacterium]